MTSKSTNRLFVDGSLDAGADLRLGDDQAHYVGRVLRLRVGDELILFNGRGGEYVAVAAEISKRGVSVRVGERREREVESPLAIHLIQAMGRGERMDFVVQKATELGVHRISPVISEFSVVRLDRAKAEKRAAHWTRITRSACEQCGRNVPPGIDLPQALETWLTDNSSSETERIVLRPDAGETLASRILSAGRLELLTGPEGGFSDAEYERTAAAGFIACSLGPRILRTETAALAAIAVLQSKWGDLK